MSSIDDKKGDCIAAWQAPLCFCVRLDYKKLATQIADKRFDRNQCFCISNSYNASDA
jgi:hypothetical protein